MTTDEQMLEKVRQMHRQMHTIPTYFRSFMSGALMGGYEPYDPRLPKPDPIGAAGIRALSAEEQQRVTALRAEGFVMTTDEQQAREAAWEKWITTNPPAKEPVL